MYKRNEILDRDLYKIGHWLQLKKAYQWFISYMEARIGAKHPYIITLGLSYIIQKHYSNVPTLEEIEVADKIVTKAVGYQMLNVNVWKKINSLGYYPMLIKGLPEGIKAPIGTPLFTIEPTQEWFASTCNGEETKLMRSWYPMALATRLHILKETLKPMFEAANCLHSLDFSINGFEARSASSPETSDIAGMVSLFINKGSDNVHGQHMLNHYYKGGEDRLKSVWATEHSCALSFGPGEGEYDYVKSQLSTHTNRIKSIVIDTFYTKNFIDNVMNRADIRKLVLAHDGLIVFRNDSGDIVEMITYILWSLSENYGLVYDKDSVYKRLDNNLAVMQADGVNPNSVFNLYETIFKDNWSPEVLVVGGGTGLMFDELTRDYNRNAIKPSINKIDGEMINVNKVVVSDPSKGSKPGKLKVTSDLITHSSVDYTEGEFDKIECIMVPYYHDGKILVNNFDEVFANINN